MMYHRPKFDVDQRISTRVTENDSDVKYFYVANNYRLGNGGMVDVRTNVHHQPFQKSQIKQQVFTSDLNYTILRIFEPGGAAEPSELVIIVSNPKQSPPFA